MKLIILLLSFSAVAATIPYRNFTMNHLIVKLKPQETMPVSSLIKSSRKLFLQIYSVQTDDLINLERELKDHPAVSYTERNFISSKRELAKRVPTFDLDNIIKAQSPFNDPKVGRIWSFRDGADNGISISKAYRNRTGDQQQTEIIVAVVDTGVDYRHEDLKDIMWVNSDEIPNNNIDDDGNGYVDDIHGINTLKRNRNSVPTGNMMDTHDHGTHVSGTIAAVQNNNIGIAGIASKVKIMGIRTVPNNGDETDINVIESFIYAAKNGARIINCSFGKDVNEGGSAVSEAIDFIGKEYGVLVVAAAGNDSRNIDNRLSYPASFPNENLLIVASTSKFGGLSFFTNYGIKNVDLSAPGSGIYSTTRNNGYYSMSGTSMASPATAGVAAEVLSFHPELSPGELKKILMDSVTKLNSHTRKMVSGGRVDLYQALEKLNN